MKKETMSLHPLCKICKYDCKVTEFAKIESCRAMREDKEMLEMSNKITKEYDKRK